MAQRGPSLLILLLIVAIGAAMFITLEPDKGHTPLRAAYYTWSLVFAQPPEPLPASPGLAAMFFIVPIVGLTVILEAIVEVSRMIRDRHGHEQPWCRIMSQSMSGHIVLVGLGRLGSRTFAILRRLGEKVVVIEKDPQGQFLEGVRRDGSPHLLGDARDDVMLERAGIARAKSIILATEDDLTNLEVALDARRVNPGIRVVLRMFDQNLADKVRDGFNIHIAMSQSAISAPVFATAAIERSIVSGTVVGDRLVVMRRWAVAPGDALDGRTIEEVMVRERIGVVELKPGGAEPVLFPPPGTRLAAGDEVLLQGDLERVAPLGART